MSALIVGRFEIFSSMFVRRLAKDGGLDHIRTTHTAAAREEINTRHSNFQDRTFLVPAGALLVGVGDFQNCFFAEGFAEELQADGEAWLRVES